MQTGVRYQTNATAGPSGSLIRVFGFDGVLDQKFVKQPDWEIRARHRLSNRGSADAARRQFGRRRPVPMPPSSSRLSAWTLPPLGSRPGHASYSTPASHLARGFRSGPTSADRWLPSRKIYLGSGMAGAAITWLPAPGWSVELGGDRGHRRFHNTASYTTADLQTGEMTTGYASLRGPLLDGVRWQARGGISAMMRAAMNRKATCSDCSSCSCPATSIST